MIFKPTVGAVVVCAVVCAAAPTAAQQWQQAKCELKPGHVSVNRGMLYVKSASETRFADKRQKDLNDAEALQIVTELRLQSFQACSHVRSPETQNAQVNTLKTFRVFTRANMARPAGSMAFHCC